MYPEINDWEETEKPMMWETGKLLPKQSSQAGSKGWASEERGQMDELSLDKGKDNASFTKEQKEEYMGTFVDWWFCWWQDQVVFLILLIFSVNKGYENKIGRSVRNLWRKCESHLEV